MTDQNVESAQNLSGEQPGQAANQEGGGDKLSSPAKSAELSALREEVSTLQKELRGIQSRGDKDRVEVDSLKDTIAKYASFAGVEVDPRAIREMQIDELLAGGSFQQKANVPPRGSEQTSPPHVQGQSQTAEADIDFASLFQLVGVDPNDNRVINAARQYGNDPVRLKASLVDIKSQSQPRSNPSGASAAAPVGGQAITKTDQEILQAEYYQKKKTIRPGSRDMQSLRTEMRRRGLRI